MTQRWYGQRSSTRATIDFDMAMSTVKLETPDGQGFATREAAALALRKMIAAEIMAVIAYSPYGVNRLAKILAQLIENPTWNQAEYDGLQFAIWPVDYAQPTRNTVVTNVSDLTLAMRTGLLNWNTAKVQTRRALIARGLVEDYRGGLTDAGKRALAMLEQ